jgi:hypothetical protein
MTMTHWLLDPRLVRIAGVVHQDNLNDRVEKSWHGAVFNFNSKTPVHETVRNYLNLWKMWSCLIQDQHWRQLSWIPIWWPIFKQPGHQSQWARSKNIELEATVPEFGPRWFDPNQIVNIYGFSHMADQ